LETFHAGAAALSVTAIEAPFHDAVEIEALLTNLASNSDAGLVVMPGTGTSVHRELICALAARLRLPTIYPFRYFISSGGCFPTALTRAICFEVRHLTSTAYCGERKQTNFQFNCRPNSKW
jgi:hypothetical protein